MSSGREERLYTIGQLVDRLKSEFENISVSKVRFLEGEGLITPHRSKGGYRRFTAEDVERMRAILHMQNHEYLPLHVIRQRLREFQPGASSVRQSKKGAGAKATQASPNGSMPAGRELPRSEFMKLGRLSDEDLDQLEQYGLVKGRKSPEGKIYLAGDLAIVEAAKALGRFGLEARHLKIFGTFAEREAAMCKQIAGPVKRRTAEAQRRSEQLIREIASNIARLQDALLARQVQDLTGQQGD